MSVNRGIIWFAIVAISILATICAVWKIKPFSPSLMTIQGAVIRLDKDPHKQLPIAGVQVTAAHGGISKQTQSEASGYFTIVFPEPVWPGQEISLSFQRTDYQPLDMKVQVSLSRKPKRLYVAELQPVVIASSGTGGPSDVIVSNIRVRYTVNAQTDQNIGSAAQTFQVVRQGESPCTSNSPCSPDGNWAASRESVTMDAGVGNEYRNVRASCIAGPCPFTVIDSRGFERGGRLIRATAEAWSGTATFLLEAEVFHTAITSSVRESYPVLYDRALNFTLPPTEEGVSIEADIGGTPMVFPLGPDLDLSWTVCNVSGNSDVEKSTVYRCELKPGYRF